MSKSKDKLAFIFDSKAASGLIPSAIAGVYFHSGKEDYFAYREDLNLKAELLESMQMDNPSLNMDVARSAGVEHRWEWEQFFSTLEHRPELGYLDDRGAHRSWTTEELIKIQAGERVAVNGSTIEGHHINSIQGNEEDIHSAMDPENVILATRKAHHDLHNGDWQNPTSGAANEISERLREAEGVAKESILDEKIWASIENSLYVSAGISSLLNFYSLKNDPRPWNQKASILVVHTFMDSAAGGSATFIALATTRMIEDTFEDFIAGAGDSILSDVLETGGGIGIGQVVLIMSRAGKMAYEGKGVDTIKPMIGNAMLAAGSKVAAGLAISTLLSAAGVPDPTGITQGIMIFYTIGKLAWDANSVKKLNEDYQIYFNKKLDKMYENALLAAA